MHNLFDGFVRASNGQIERIAGGLYGASMSAILLNSISPYVLPIIREVDEKYGVNFIWPSPWPEVAGLLVLTIAHEYGYAEIRIDGSKLPYTWTVRELNTPIAVEAIGSRMFLDYNDDRWKCGKRGIRKIQGKEPKLYWTIDGKSVTFFSRDSGQMTHTFDGPVSEVTLRHVLLADGRLYEWSGADVKSSGFEAYKAAPARKQPNFGC
jgi:hypothetical protein